MFLPHRQHIRAESVMKSKIEINKWQKLVDEAQNAIDQLNTAHRSTKYSTNVKASGDPDTSSEQAR